MKILKSAPFALVCFVSSLYGTNFVDDFANTDNISAFGNATDSVNSGILTLSRTDSGGDAGVNWLIDGTTRFSLTPSNQQDTIRITPEAQVTNGEWSSYILFFNGSGGFLSENLLSDFTDSTSVLESNIANFAVSEGVVGAEEYFLRIRLQGETSSGFQFSEFAAVPEPEHIAFMGGVLIVVYSVFRRKL